MIVVVMGVAGCGKSTLGRALAAKLGCAFIEGDEFHPPASRRKMASGVPLDDADRWPWLDALAAELGRRAQRGESIVLACSALKYVYRERLRRGCPRLRLVFLHGAEACISQRLAARRGHYMPPSLLQSQLATLELPRPSEAAVLVDVEAPIQRSVETVIATLQA